MFLKREGSRNNDSGRYADGGYDIYVAKNAEDVERLRETWERLQYHPETDIDNFLTEYKSGKHNGRPHVMLLSKDGTGKTLIVGKIEDMALQFWFGYKKLEIKTRALIVSQGGVLGEISYSSSKATIRALMNVLIEGEATIIYLSSLQMDSYIYKLSKSLPSFFTRDYFPERGIGWRLSLTGSYKDYLSTLSRNTRDNIRKFSNRVGRKYGERLSLRYYRKPEELDLIMKDTESIARKTWQRAVGVGFFDNNTTRQRYELALGRRQLYVYILYIDDKPVVFRHGLRYGNTYYGEITGMDPAYRDDRLGTILLLKMIEKLCEKQGIKVLDFGTGGDEGGNAEHKRIFCNELCEKANVCIYAPTIRGVMVNATRSFLSATKIVAKRILDYLKLKERVKRHWRQSALRGNTVLNGVS